MTDLTKIQERNMQKYTLPKGRKGLEYYASVWENDWKEYKNSSPDSLLDDKNAVLFPEKIQGKYWMLRRFLPDIQIISFNNLDELLETGYWVNFFENLDDNVLLRASTQPWMNYRIGAGAPPIKTKDGWLLLYHGVQERENKKPIYRMGAALLDIENPKKVLAYTHKPFYEKGRISFPCASFLRKGNGEGDWLDIIYGGGDRYTARIAKPLKSVLEKLS